MFRTFLSIIPPLSVYPGVSISQRGTLPDNDMAGCTNFDTERWCAYTGRIYIQERKMCTYHIFNYFKCIVIYNLRISVIFFIVGQEHTTRGP